MYSMKKLIFLCLTLFSINLYAQKAKHTFALGDSTFLLDGKPLQIISGEMHCYRIPRAYWRDRIRKAKMMGLNTVATYIFWNIEHMYTKGQPKPLAQALIDYMDSAQGHTEEAALQFVSLSAMQSTAITAHNAVPKPS